MSSLSRAADVNFRTIKNIYRNPYKDVTTTTLAKIAKALGVPSTDLIEDVPDEGIVPPSPDNEDELEEHDE